MFRAIISLVLYLSMVCTSFCIAQSIEEKFQNVLDSVYEKHTESIGILIHVEAPGKNISWSGAVGISKKETNNKLEIAQPFLIASNTKTYIAAAILKLIETKKLSLDMSLRAVITDLSCAKLEKAGYDIDAITVKNLLSHTSGIADYVTDAYFNFVDNNKAYHWNRDEQISRSTRVEKPLGKAGTIYTYADVNYLLLTEILELKTQLPFYEAIRNLLQYKAHGLNETWFIQLEKKPKDLKPLVHQYWNEKKWDSYDLNPSWDLYGGGGIAATSKDMALFYNKLFSGAIISNRVILEQMYTPKNLKLKTRYGLGVQNIKFNKYEAYYHGGFWGTDVLYIPEYKITIAATTLQKEERELNATISKTLLKLLIE